MLDTNFNNDIRKKQELLGRPIAEVIYRQVFGDNIEIVRFEHEDNYELDRTFAMDVKIINPTGLILIGQEKFLSNEYIRFKTLTIEYMQNPSTQERGDWFKMAVQFYFVGYFNKLQTGFDLWVVADWARVVLETLNENIFWEINSNKNGKARANFKYCIMTSLPDNCIISSSWGYK